MYWVRALAAMALSRKSLRSGLKRSNNVLLCQPRQVIVSMPQVFKHVRTGSDSKQTKHHQSSNPKKNMEQSGAAKS